MASAGVAVAGVAASILVPSALVSAYALLTADAAAIVRFALRVAEPTALAAAATVVLLLPARGSRTAGALRGVATAVAMGAAALWVGDVDAWTYAAFGLLPLAGALRAGRGAQRSRAVGVGATSAAALPGVLPLAIVDPVSCAESARERVTSR